MKKTLALLVVLLLLFALLTTALSSCAPKEEPVTSSLREEIIFSTEYSLKAYSYEKVSEFSDAVRQPYRKLYLSGYFLCAQRCRPPSLLARVLSVQ